MCRRPARHFPSAVTSENVWADRHESRGGRALLDAGEVERAPGVAGTVAQRAKAPTLRTVGSGSRRSQLTGPAN
jgi:hypothetical protein